MTALASPGNAEQAQRWNGEGGQRWITYRERHQASHRRLLPHLFGGAAISPGDRVLDVGPAGTIAGGDDPVLSGTPPQAFTPRPGHDPRLVVSQQPDHLLCWLLDGPHRLASARPARACGAAR